MKLKEGFVTHSLLGRDVMVAVGPAAKTFRGIAEANDSAAFIIEQLKNETTEEKIVEALMSEYDVGAETAKRDVSAIVEKLRSIGAID